MPVVLPANAPAQPATERRIESRVLGHIVIDAQSLVHFSDGLCGFENHREFALLPAARDGLWWLQSLDEPALAFLLVDTFRVTEGYEVELSAGDKARLQLESPDDALVLSVVTLPADPAAPATTNLRGPIVFNTTRRLARQVVVTTDGPSLHHAVDLRALAERE